jgi:predicted HicB family RNase H-like nuclease
MAVGSDSRPDVRAILVRMQPEMRLALRIAAAEEDMSLEALVREVLGQYLRERADERELVGK